MKKTFAFFLFAGISLVIRAQQAPQFTQFMQTGNMLNPAFTGISRNGDFKIGYRKQWIGLEGAPTTMFAAGSAMLGIDEPVISLPVRGRLSSQFKTEKPEVKDGLKHSIGAYLQVDKTGPATFNRGALTYAAHLPLRGDWKLSAGAGILISQSSLNRSDFNVLNDPGLTGRMSSELKPDLQMGFMLYSSNLFLGYSGNYLFQNKLFTLSDEQKLFARQRVHHYGFAAYRFELSENFSLVPTVMAKYVSGAPVSIESNVRMNVREKFWLGLGFRPQDAGSVFAGMHISEKLNLSYAYDYNLSPLNEFNNGSHEIILGIRFVKKGEKLYRPVMW